MQRSGSKRPLSVFKAPMSENNQVEEQVQRIQDKLQQLLRQRDLLLRENGRLKEDLRKAQEGQAGDIKRLEQLKQQVEVLRVTRTAMSEGEKRELEKRLGQYIREIDRCIALLGE
jgi:chromosome segregation ATPase